MEAIYQARAGQPAEIEAEHTWFPRSAKKECVLEHAMAFQQRIGWDNA